jgi:thioredoxin-related protein
MSARLFLIFTFLFSPLAAAQEYPAMGPDVYDTKADGNVQVAEALQDATAHRKNVMLVFGANWCIWCRRLDQAFTTVPEVVKALRSDFVVVNIDVNTRKGSKRNADVDARYGNPIANGVPMIVVLDAKGKQLTTLSTDELEEDAGHSPKKILAFLAKWMPAK